MTLSCSITLYISHINGETIFDSCKFQLEKRVKMNRLSSGTFDFGDLARKLK